MRSIRLFLIASILATLTLSNFLGALRGYQSSMAEAEVLFDNQLLDISRLISNLDYTMLDADFRLGNNIAFQVWRAGENQGLIASSLQAPSEAIMEFAPGFDFKNFNGYRWRTYSRFDVGKNHWVFVAERTDLRFVLAENVILESLFPILLSLPIVALLIWIIVSRSLTPLKRLSQELKHKQSNDLSPIQYSNTSKELAQVVQSTNDFIQRLSDALEREKRFSADAAHELRTPISALKIQLHNLSEEMGNNESLLHLENGVERMQHLIEQLLALYHTTPAQFNSNKSTLNLFEISQNVIANYYADFENKQQNLELRGENCAIYGEKFALEILISNLLSNANKYTQNGGEIIVSIVEYERSFELTIEDNGPGIKEADTARIFDRFYRSGSAHDQSHTPGCGLGLAIVSHVADLHQATVTLHQSSFNRGSLFKVSFAKVDFYESA